MEAPELEREACRTLIGLFLLSTESPQYEGILFIADLMGVWYGKNGIDFTTCFPVFDASKTGFLQRVNSWNANGLRTWSPCVMSDPLRPTPQVDGMDRELRVWNLEAKSNLQPVWNWLLSHWKQGHSQFPLLRPAKSNNDVSAAFEWRWCKR